MASLYIHIPFCKKACHYCSFYFTLSTNKKEELVKALCSEIKSRKTELNVDIVNSIYFGGGTPSLLKASELQIILDTIHANYNIASDAEITIESNPENLTETYLNELKGLSFNRLSIGVQSFFDEDLLSMNRNHNQEQAMIALELAKKIFNNVSIDLIFGLPYSNIHRWLSNLEIATELGIDHISTYNLTVEEKTALARKIAKKELSIESDDTLNTIYLQTIEYLNSRNLIQYEISNFGKKTHWSRHNISYWTQLPYLGFGPSAHSYNGNERSWNVSNLKSYIESLENGKTYSKKEILSLNNKYNEYVLTRLRTIFGVNIDEIKTTFGKNFESHIESKLSSMKDQNWLIHENGIIKLTNIGKVLADHIACELML